MNTKTKLLDLAEQLTRTKGFNGFSYLHLAAELDIKTSSVHYHFKTKADLALAMLERVRHTHESWLRGLERDVEDPRERLLHVIRLFQGYAESGEFCLCGMMSSELHSVSPEARASLQGYFETLRAWVEVQVEALGFEDAPTRALQFVGALEGTLLLARLHADPEMVLRALSPLIGAPAALEPGSWVSERCATRGCGWGRAPCDTPRSLRSRRREYVAPSHRACTR